jgi:hypothetical protein
MMRFLPLYVAFAFFPTHIIPLSHGCRNNRREGNRKHSRKQELGYHIHSFHWSLGS